MCRDVRIPNQALGHHGRGRFGTLLQVTHASLVVGVSEREQRTEYRWGYLAPKGLLLAGGAQ